MTSPASPTRRRIGPRAGFDCSSSANAERVSLGRSSTCLSCTAKNANPTGHGPTPLNPRRRRDSRRPAAGPPSATRAPLLPPPRCVAPPLILRLDAGRQAGPTTKHPTSPPRRRSSDTPSTPPTPRGNRFLLLQDWGVVWRWNWDLRLWRWNLKQRIPPIVLQTWAKPEQNIVP